MHYEEDRKAREESGNGVEDEEPATECTCPRRSGKRHAAGKQLKRIPDFNLLNIPSSVDMHEVMTHYIMPRLPDGYRVKADAINVQQQKRRSSLLKYAMPELKRRSQKRDSNVVTELLEPTHSPRYLFPTMSYKKAFQVELLPEEEPSDGQQEKNGDRKEVYMLSRFLKDLDNLKLAQCPKFQKTLNESLLLNRKKGSSGKDAAVNTADGDDRTARSDLEMWTSALKIIEADEEDLERESPGSYEEEEDGKCRFCKQREDAAKSHANMGHWSSRDVHDVKFNEDKLTIQFRTGRLGYFGFAANRYSNLPFQVVAWIRRV